MLREFNFGGVCGPATDMFYRFYRRGSTTRLAARGGLFEIISSTNAVPRGQAAGRHPYRAKIRDRVRAHIVNTLSQSQR